MTDKELFKYCDEFLRYSGSNTGIKGISFNPHHEMFSVRYNCEHFGTDCFLEEAFATLIHVAHNLNINAKQREQALAYLLLLEPQLNE